MSKNKKKSFIARFICILFIALAGYAAFQFIYPDVAALKKENPKKTAFMKYREREWEREGKKYKVNQKWVSLSAVSPFLIKAVLIGEDDKFWQHEGFDYEAMQKAIEKDIKEKKFKLGGSTISQQLTKNLYLSPSKNPVRKLREAVITYRMEKAINKKRILELYLNVAEWGDRGIFGIEAASRHYYSKSASMLNPEEAARLASVLPNPRKFDPLGTSKYVQNRSRLIYNIMVKRGIVVPEYEEINEGGAADQPPPEQGQPPVEETKPSER
ncbi:MAG: monofunctional biosynthetic peptidoglycan transglycosylase [Thermodesulfovibrionales bacterium]